GCKVYRHGYPLGRRGRATALHGRECAGGGPRAECGTSPVSDVYVLAGVVQFWDRGYERKVHPIGLSPRVQSSLAVDRSRRLRLRHSHPDAPPVRRTGKSGTVPQAAGAGLVFLLRTWRPLAVSWCREYAYRPSSFPSDPDRL